MSLKHALMPRLAALITSPGRQRWQRRTQELRRRLARRPHRAVFYFRADDPYSVLLLQLLPAFSAHFGLQIQPRVMQYLDQEMYPEPELLAELGRRDAVALAAFCHLEFPDTWEIPSHDRVQLATRILLRHEQDPAFMTLAMTDSRALWSGGGNATTDALTALAADSSPMPEDQTRMAMEARRDQFLREGHYLTGTLHYGGEWYWGIDRLDHLARRMDELDQHGHGTGPAHWPHPYGRAKNLQLPAANPHVAGKTLVLYFSFRSPYSWLVLPRAYRLADHYGLTLDVRPVLPMVMRGLSVPRAKRFYIVYDAAREARLHGVPFGKICDPVGTGVERCMALWPFAEKEGKLRDWLRAAARGIWSQGTNPASDAGLQTLCEQAGLDWNRARRWLDDKEWIARATSNRDEMVAAGSWGVPTLVLDGTLYWGQDRLGLIEQQLLDFRPNTHQPNNNQPDNKEESP